MPSSVMRPEIPGPANVRLPKVGKSGSERLDTTSKVMWPGLPGSVKVRLPGMGSFGSELAKHNWRLILKPKADKADLARLPEGPVVTSKLPFVMEAAITIVKVPSTQHQKGKVAGHLKEHMVPVKNFPMKAENPIVGKKTSEPHLVGVNVVPNDKLGSPASSSRSASPRSIFDPTAYGLPITPKKGNPKGSSAGSANTSRSSSTSPPGVAAIPWAKIAALPASSSGSASSYPIVCPTTHGLPVTPKKHGSKASSAGTANSSRTPSNSPPTNTGPLWAHVAAASTRSNNNQQNNFPVTPKNGSKASSAGTASSSRTPSSSPPTSTGPLWAKVAAAPAHSNNNLQNDFPVVGSKKPSRKRASSPKQTKAAKSQPTVNNLTEFSTDNFPTLGAQVPQQKESEKTDWKPSRWDELAGDVPTWDGLTEAQRTEKGRLDWQEYRAPFEAKARAIALERDNRRKAALKVAEKLKKEDRCQMVLPKELWIGITLMLNSTDRMNFMLTCKDARSILAEVITSWDVTAGVFYQGESGRKLPGEDDGLSKKITQNAVTIVQENKEHPAHGYMGHGATMMKRMVLATQNIAGHFRHLEFHNVSLLNIDLLRFIIPTMRNLEYLGVFRCILFDIGDTMDLLKCIRTGRKKGRSVKLDFFPNLNFIHWKQVNVRVAIPALLYDILPQARQQNAGLTDPGGAFLSWLGHSGSGVTTRLLEKIEAKLQDEYVIQHVGAKKWQGAKTEFAPNSNDARLYKCAGHTGHTGRLRGCFFPKTQLSEYPDGPECWGCRLLQDIHDVRTDNAGFGPSYDVLNKGWLHDSFDIQTVLQIARDDQPIPAKDDITFGQFLLRRDEEKEIARLREMGVLQPWETELPRRKGGWAKPRKGGF